MSEIAGGERLVGAGIIYLVSFYSPSSSQVCSSALFPQSIKCSTLIYDRVFLFVYSIAYNTLNKQLLGGGFID